MKSAVIDKPKMNESKKEQIVKDFLPYIKYTASRLSLRLPPQLTVDDLISAGVMGLLDALNRYKEGMVKLSTFVEYRIKGAMLDEIRANDWVPKTLKKKINDVKKAHHKLQKELGRLPEAEEIAKELDISLDEYYSILQNDNTSITLRFEDFNEAGHGDNDMDILECISDPSAKNPLDSLEEKRKKEMLANLIGKLPEKEKLVLSLYYWEELTMKEIAKALNLTEGRVSQLHNQAVIRLKAMIGNL